MTETTPTIDPYVIRTRGVITASKLKMFMRCPFSYWLIFEKEQPLDRREKRYFKLGTAYDDMICYHDKFFQKYVVLDDGENCVTEDDLIRHGEKLATLKIECQEREEKLKAITAHNAALPEDAPKKDRKPTTAAEKAVTSWTQKVIDEKKRCDLIEERLGMTQLTQAEFKIVKNAFDESKRQPMFELGAEGVEYQKRFTAKFHGLKLSGTLDRYFPGKAIRDMKLIDDCEKAQFKVVDNDYLFSMAFYQLLVELNTGKKLPCILDFLDKKEVCHYRPIELPQDLMDTERNRIQSALVFLEKCKTDGYFPHHAEIGNRDDVCAAYEHCPGAIKTDIEVYS